MGTRSFASFAVVVAIASFSVVSARADWNPDDPFKMHFPQLPDTNGWDVLFTQPQVLADDWLCTESGPVSAVHLWFSSQLDRPFSIGQVHLSIHADIPAGSAGVPYSRPGDLLWQADLFPTDFSIRFWGTGDQGWYDPNTGFWQRPDHLNIWQLNIPNLPDPLEQQQGIIYWLDVSVVSDVSLGWKSSLQHFNDDAVRGDFPAPNWMQLRDLLTGDSLDLAFVITTVPEPSSTLLANLSGALLLVLMWRKRNAHG